METIGQVDWVLTRYREEENGKIHVSFNIGRAGLNQFFKY